MSSPLFHHPRSWPDDTYIQIDVSVNAPMSGKIVELLAEEDSTVTVGQDLLRIEPGEGASTAKDEPPKASPEGGARSEPKNPEEGNKADPAPEAKKEKGASEEVKQKQDEKAPGQPAPEQQAAPQKEAPKPAPKESKGKESESGPAPAKTSGSRNETRVCFFSTCQRRKE